MGGPAAGAKQKVSIAGGAQPAWRADGKELFNAGADSILMSVSAESGASLKARCVETAVPNPPGVGFVPAQYDVSANGNRFPVEQPLEESASVPITVIVNWPALLKKGAAAR
jgi:hypothetical protein